MDSSNYTVASMQTCLSRINGRPSQDTDEINFPYAEDLYMFYQQQQNVRRPLDYMDNQPAITADIRAHLVSLLALAHCYLKLEPETLYLSVYIVDRFLSFYLAKRRQLPVICISSLLIATKYEEDWVPEVSEFLIGTEGYYTTQDLCFWEKMILEKLDWYLTVPTVFMFLVRFVQAAKADKELEHMIYFYGELGLMEYRLILYSPSMVAASSVYAARCALKRSPCWTDTLQQYTSYTEPQLLDCAKILAKAHLAAEPYGKIKIQTFHQKYLQEQFGSVARYPPAMNLIKCKQSSCVAP